MKKLYNKTDWYTNMSKSIKVFIYAYIVNFSNIMNASLYTNVFTVHYMYSQEYIL